MNILSMGRWSPYIIGFLIGVLSWFSFLFSKRPIGVSTAFARLSGIIEKMLYGPEVEQKEYYQEYKPIVDWEVMLIIGLILGSFISSLLSGQFQFEVVPALWLNAFGSTPILRIITALIGGFFVGLGARWAGGCTSGHGISGTMQLAVSSWLAVICFFLGGVITATLIY
ncbi:MAG TPA: YeeE/YedE thiosulfate transporter family protein [Halanaerobiales bacterium]|nr:YeeE/YedE thiosulfate transporter family protein [Halanaerobiales bacterium]